MVICKDCGTEKEHKARGMCSSCYNHWYYRENHERELERARCYRGKNSEKIKATNRRWRRDNPDKVSALNARRRVPKKTQRLNIICRICGKERSPCGDKGLCRPCYMHCYWKEHQEEYRARKRDWRKRNPEKNQMEVNRRRACERGMANTLTLEQLEFEKRIGEATYPGEKLHLHHIVPISKGGGHTWGNVAFIPALLNIRIQDKLPVEVYEQLTLNCC